MGKGEHLGEFEQIVLLAVGRRPDCHGAQIHEEILETTGRDVSLATVYVTLARLVKKGHLVEAVEGGGEERGGRPRKVYSLSDQGVGELSRARLQLERLWRGLEFDPLAAGDR